MVWHGYTALLRQLEGELAGQLLVTTPTRRLTRLEEGLSGSLVWQTQALGTPGPLGLWPGCTSKQTLHGAWQLVPASAPAPGRQQASVWNTMPVSRGSGTAGGQKKTGAGSLTADLHERIQCLAVGAEVPSFTPELMDGTLFPTGSNGFQGPHRLPLGAFSGHREGKLDQ